MVLRNHYNQGYGGNQKVGYAHAICERFDFVALLHGARASTTGAARARPSSRVRKR